MLFFTIQKRIGEIYRKNKGIEKIIKRGYQIKKQGFCIGKESYKINWKNDTIVIILSEKLEFEGGDENVCNNLCSFERIGKQ